MSIAEGDTPAGTSNTPGLGMRLTIAGIRQKFSSVCHISTEQLALWINQAKDIGSKEEKTSSPEDPTQTTKSPSMHSSNKILILDSRPEEEYRIGHIAGAVRVDYGADVDKILAYIPHTEELPDKTVVCYCSVGYRSSMVADKLQKYYQKKGYTTDKLHIYNLEGSIFKWANERRRMVDSNNQSTSFTHPYNGLYGKLLNKEYRKTSIEDTEEKTG